MKETNTVNKEKRYDGFAIASFVLGLISIALVLGIFINFRMLSGVILFSPISALLSLIFGIIALVRIKRNENKKGMLFAIFGMLLSIFIFSVVFVVLVILNSLRGIISQHEKQ